MSVQILDKEALYREKVQNARVDVISLYSGDADLKSKDSNPILETVVTAVNGKWGPGSAGYRELWNDIKTDVKRLTARTSGKKFNADQGPSYEEIDSFVSKIIFDITARMQTQADYSSMIANEVVNPNFAEKVFLQEMMPYAGKFRTVGGTGDPAPLVQSDIGSQEFFTIGIEALGYKTSLHNLLFNELFMM